MLETEAARKRRGSDSSEREAVSFMLGDCAPACAEGTISANEIFLFTEVEVMANLDARVAGESIIPAEIILQISLERGIYPN